MVFYLYFPIQQGGNGPIFTTCSYSHINTKKVGKKREMLFQFPSGKVYYLPCEQFALNTPCTLHILKEYRHICP
jgi:hypothetical protein